ncbi:hypothetical protein [Nocardia sp. N2S4-5]|uniref:hypothetical protein n=1 Tax=Nocardia sp. N2S4-5 TaxID=3351565 RepID=UPI0037D519C8
MNVLGWQVGLVIVIGIPLVVFAIAVLWPQRTPEDKSVRGIRDRIEGEDGR